MLVPMYFRRNRHFAQSIFAAKIIGAGGRTRTDTTFYGPRILSPVRLPFRHTGSISQWVAKYTRDTKAASGQREFLGWFSFPGSLSIRDAVALLGHGRDL